MAEPTTAYAYDWLPDMLQGDMVDLRDVVARLNELADDEDRDEGETEELEALQAFARDFAAEMSDTLASVADNEPGMIADSYFEDYAQELADDLGMIPRDNSWPVSFIDWPAAAAALQQDYVSFEFAGQTWWIRSW